MDQLTIDNKSGIGNNEPMEEFYSNLFAKQNEEMIFGDFNEVANIVINALHSIVGRDENHLMNHAYERVFVNLLIYNRISSFEQRSVAIELFKNDPEELLFRVSDLFFYVQASDVELDRGRNGMKGIWDKEVERSLYSGDPSYAIKKAVSILSGFTCDFKELLNEAIFNSSNSSNNGAVEDQMFPIDPTVNITFVRVCEKLEMKCEAMLRKAKFRAKKESKSLEEILYSINGGVLPFP
ncbi:hypothetical protein JW796_01360 [Candidatus Dojkabacteria bacterium]|nr:hypothetical protein [Candidatus Dojkabacteria bacterium]